MKNSDKEYKLFYASYANLMAGLLFVFLFIIGAILLKSALTQNDFQQEKALLATQKAKFEEEKLNFIRQQERLLEFGKTLNLENLNSKDKEILALLTSLEEKDRKLRGLKDEFNALKQELWDLAFIKNNFIFELQAKFDARILLDAQNKAFVLPSDMVFEANSPLIKNEMKSKLRAIFTTYFNAILQNKELMKGLEQINLEVLLDDEALFLHRADLATRRANELIAFIHSFYKDERVQKYLFISTRILDKNKQNGVLMRLVLSDEFILQKVEELLNQ